MRQTSLPRVTGGMRGLSSAIIIGTAMAGALGASASPASNWEAALSSHLSAPDPTGLRRFDYERFVADTDAVAILDTYIAELASSGPPDGDDEATAYWANLYNAVTIDVVVDNYPVESIRDIRSGVFRPGPWKRGLVTVDGETLSLDDIEHGILRVHYPDPLIHYMVNCASVGCPNLQPRLWRAETLDADRQSAAREFVNSPRGIRRDKDRLVVSSIYKWYDEDFGGNRSSVIEHIRTYADDERLALIGDADRYDDHAYDWSLNAPE